MPHIQTAYFGNLACEPHSFIRFPAGLPGFEQERDFVPVEMPEYHPLVFLQSARTPGLCFLALPVRAVDPEYRLEASPEDVALAGFPARRQPAIGRDALCLAVITIDESGISANLLAPILVNLAARLAVQAIQPAGRYSHRQPLEAAEVAPCS